MNFLFCQLNLAFSGKIKKTPALVLMRSRSHSNKLSSIMTNFYQSENGAKKAPQNFHGLPQSQPSDSVNSSCELIKYAIDSASKFFLEVIKTQQLNCVDFSDEITSENSTQAQKIRENLEIQEYINKRNHKS